MRVAIRVDASNRVGSGHFMRCLTLAHALEPFCTKIAFVSRFMHEHSRECLLDNGYAFFQLDSSTFATAVDDLEHSHWLGVSQEQDVAQSIQALSPGQWDWLVVDHYGIDHRWESALRRLAARILVIDDLADRQHDCDALIDQNLYADKETRYDDKTPAECELFLGPECAFLRDEFHQIRPQVKPRRGKVRHVLVYFGGADADNHTMQAMNALLSTGCDKLAVDVVISKQHPDRKDIESICSANNFVCHIQTQRMAALMARADLAIGAGGISTFERLYLRLPAILKPISSNQIEPLEYMSSIGLFDLFRSQEELETKLRKALDRPNQSPPDCVGDGNKELVRYMVNEFASLRNPIALDVRHTFYWLQDEQLRDDFLVGEAPIPAGHFTYWRKLLTDASQRVYSIYHFGKHVGNCGLKNIDLQSQTSELWIYLADTSARGKGVAKCAVLSLLSKAALELSCKSVYLHVAKVNRSAIALYQKARFSESSEALVGPWLGRDAEIQRMECVL